MTQPVKPKSKWPRRILLGLVWVVTLVVLFHAEENWRGERAWNKYRAEQEAKGEKLRLADYIPPRVPDAQNFAATPFFAPLFDYKHSTTTPRDTNALERVRGFAATADSIPQHGRWTTHQPTDLAHFAKEYAKSTNSTGASLSGNTNRAEAAAVVLAQLAAFEPVIEELRQASRRPQSRFNIDYEAENPAAILLPHLSVVRRVAKLVKLRASAELALGKTDAAYDDVNLILRLSDSVRAEPVLVSVLVRLSMLDLAQQVIWEGLADSRWSEAQLKELQVRLAGFDMLAECRRALQTERAGFGIAMIEYLMNSAKKAETIGQLTDSGIGSKFAAKLVFALVPRGWFRFEELNYSLFFDRYCIGAVDATAGRVAPAIAEQALNVLQTSSYILPHKVFLHLLMPAVVPILQRVAAAQTSLSEAMLACAIERHRLATGKLPENLDALVPQFVSKLPHDVINGEPLKYRRNGESGFVIYSVGWNGKDDGGTIAMKESKKDIDLERGDWVWEK